MGSRRTTDPDETQRVLDAIHGVITDIGMDDEFSVGPTGDAWTNQTTLVDIGGRTLIGETVRRRPR